MLSALLDNETNPRKTSWKHIKFIDTIMKKHEAHNSRVTTDSSYVYLILKKKLLPSPSFSGSDTFCDTSQKARDRHVSEMERVRTRGKWGTLNFWIFMKQRAIYDHCCILEQYVWQAWIVLLREVYWMQFAASIYWVVSTSPGQNRSWFVFFFFLKYLKFPAVSLWSLSRRVLSDL